MSISRRIPAPDPKDTPCCPTAATHVHYLLAQFVREDNTP